MRTAAPVEVEVARLNLTGRLVGRPANRLLAIEAGSPVVRLASGDQVGVHVAVVVHVQLEKGGEAMAAHDEKSLFIAGAGGAGFRRRLHSRGSIACKGQK